MPQELGLKLGEALKEFSQPESIANNPGIYRINEEGYGRVCFQRGDFVPSENEISQALRQYELGREAPLLSLNERISAELDVRFELVAPEIGRSGKLIITHLITISRQDIFQICGIIQP